MKDSEIKVIAEAMVKAAEISGEKIAKGMVKSAETTARSITESAEATAKSITQSTEKIANAIIDNNTKNAEALKEGFREVGKSLGGTRAELMMDVLLKQSETNGGNIPEPGSKKWNECKEIAKQVLKEFSHEE
jgi:cell division septum initiation protein DivIVA